MKGLLQPDLDQLLAASADITKPGMTVEIKVSQNGVVWVNVGPICVLRICRTMEVRIIDERVEVPS